MTMLFININDHCYSDATHIGQLIYLIKYPAFKHDKQYSPQ